ncbi:MAG: leucine-rich repeat domain-containing protein [Anaerolineaceae bacterium]|nr:leucine-rich repeat domain-containing protein [Anaerolineaceae bacterium]
MARREVKHAYDNPDHAYKEAQRRINMARISPAITLYLDGLGLTTIPPEIEYLTGLRELYLDRNRLTTVPPQIGQMASLKELYLDGNQLTSIPPEIGQLISLKELYLDRNQLPSIPSEIGKLIGLTKLSLNDNQLTTVPSEIGLLTKLEHFGLYKNKLTAVPPEIGRLTGLTWLNLNDNKLTTIPPEIGHLTALTRLELENNQLTAVPPEIRQLTRLTELFLSGNQLSAVPPEITQLTKLEHLWLYNNPDLPIPPEIVAQNGNAQAILDYLREKQETPARPLNEAKLILVGQGGVGKTSLVKRLLGQGFDEVENQTEGINIETWSLKVDRARQGIVPITLNIWDFGGQEIMHATHQFFLTKRSLYLLVLDARQGEDEGRVEYWLALINSFAPDAPVLVVINKSDQHHLDINRRGLQEKYPAIKGFIRTSARDDLGIDKLKTEIATLLATMEHVDTAFPASWMRVKTDLVTMQAQRHFLPYDEYEALCRQHGIAEESSQTTLVRFLHDLGIVLNFTDDDRVRDTSVLNPNWVTGGIYALLNSEQLQQKQGILVRNQVREMLSGVEYPSQQRRFLLDMMTKFELAFGLPGGQTLLIPDLISKEQPAFEWDDANALQFAYQYSVLPRSILHRFMVRQHQRVDEKIRWRTGVMLNHDGFTALVKADIKAATIHISIIGDGDRRQFLYSLRLEFKGIHDTIQGTKPREVVPIPGHPDAQPISYAYLEQLEKKKVDTIHYPGKDGDVILLDVQELLNGVSTSAMREAGLPNKREILAALKAGFDEKEFLELLFDLSIRPGELAGDELDARMLSLVGYVERHGRFQDLVTAIAEKRPYLFDESRRSMSNS